jgi:Leucine-rich repeat (LRR) protein
MDTQSTHSNSDRLPMSSFLHTIPEGSSDIAASSFNPAAAASAGEGSAWAAMMRPFRSERNARPAAPSSVTSNTSTRAVEAGAAMDGSITSTAVAGLGDREEDTVVEAGVTDNNYQSHTGHASHDPTRSASASGATISKRRRPSVSPLNKRKVGLVCLLAVLLVLVVIIALVVIVRQLGDATASLEVDANSAPPHNISDSDNVAGTDSDNNNLLNSTTDIDNVLEPTLPPTVAESTYLSLNTDHSNNADSTITTTTNSGSSTPATYTGAYTAREDDLVGDDAALTEDESLLVQLDEAIYMLYTAEGAQLNMLPHVSSEVFSNGLSPRYQAREWLLNNDTLLQSTIMGTSSSSSAATSSSPMDTLERIAQRYVMLVFYFSTKTDINTGTAASTPQASISRFDVQPHTHECFWVKNACGQDDAATTTTSEFILYLNVSHADLKGTIPFELGYLSRLRELFLDGNQLTGSIPDLLLTRAQYLYVLDLSQNSLQGTIPSALWTLPTLRFAYLHKNQFTGTIPLSLSEPPSSNLEEIWLRDNKLSGSIPLWWTELPNLESLSVSNNTWSGELPQEWSQVSKLEFMDVSYNEITGTIPPSLLYGIPALQHLYLDYNQLDGTLPTTEDFFAATSASISRSESKMEALWLQYNQLTGTIPEGFGWEWNRLKELELHGNRFVGEWECMDDNVWPLLEELAIDCFLEDEVQNSNSTGGVDVSRCKACCIKCF